MIVMSKERKVVETKVYSIGELAQLYEISVRTMNRWLKPHDEVIGKRVGRFYTVRQVSIIFDKLGLPKDYEAGY
ncbi:MAG: hypothetical protein J0G98_04385 [Terrimonas ferruginea]|jgi:phage antirepressor YoqD-like protein|nr:hypothetical protein [Terrimonas ferruginea]